MKSKVMICRLCNNAIIACEEDFCTTPDGEHVHSGECPPRLKRSKAVVRNRMVLNVKKEGPAGRRILTRNPSEALANKIRAQMLVCLGMEGAICSSPNIICLICEKAMYVPNRDMRRLGENGWEWAHSGCVAKVRRLAALYDIGVP